MLSKLGFRNFKSLADVEVALEPLTVLVGPNGAGKTSLLLGASLLAQVGVPVVGEGRHAWGRFAHLFGAPARSPWRLATLPGAGPVGLSMVDVGGEALSLSIGLAPPGPESVPHTGWKAAFRVRVSGPAGPADESVFPPDELVTHHPIPNPLDSERIRRLGRAVHLHLDSVVAAETSVIESEAPEMASNGHGLASTLAYLAGAHPEVVDAITHDLRQVVPGVRRIRTFRAKQQDAVMEPLAVEGQTVWRTVERTRIGDRFALELDGVGNVPADLLSEGTVLALAVLTKLHEPSGTAPRLVLLDDIDRGLHITAQFKLIGVLRALMAARPGLQIVGTTHSPYLLSQCEPREVRVMALDAQRHTRVRPLTEHPEFERLRYGFQTGELWAALGEEWVGDARPEA